MRYRRFPDWLPPTPWFESVIRRVPTWVQWVWALAWAAVTHGLRTTGDKPWLSLVLWSVLSVPFALVVGEAIVRWVRARR